MNCELALSNRKHVREQLTETVRRQNDYAEKYNALVRKTNPVAYRAGMTMLRRHARDVATLARSTGVPSRNTGSSRLSMSGTSRTRTP